jgi:hypothetical protein
MFAILSVFLCFVGVFVGLFVGFVVFAGASFEFSGWKT